MLTPTAVATLSAVAMAADARRQAVAMEAAAVLEARAAGVSWSSIAAMLGTSKQAAAQRFTPKRATAHPRLF